jgi:hypothetical protein
MVARKEFEMTGEELEELLDACKPTPVMYLSGGTPMFKSPQENANYVWQRLGEKYGFKWDTVAPVPGKYMSHFTAELLEPPKDISGISVAAV